MFHRSTPIVRTLRSFATQQDVNNAMSIIEVLVRPDIFQREYKSLCHRLSATVEAVYATAYHSTHQKERKSFLDISFEFSRSIDGYNHPNRNTNSVADTEVFVTTKPGLALQYGPIAVVDRKSKCHTSNPPSSIKYVVTPVGQLKIFSDEESLEYFQDPSIGFHHFHSKEQYKVVNDGLAASLKGYSINSTFKYLPNFDGDRTLFLLLSGTSVVPLSEIYIGLHTHQKILFPELRCQMMNVVGSAVFNFVNNIQQHNTPTR